MSFARRLGLVVGELLLTSGALVLLHLVWQLWWTDLAAFKAHDEILQRTRSVFEQSVSDVPGDRAQTAAEPFDTEMPQAEYIVHLPTIEAVHPVVDDVDEHSLSLGVLGHYPETQLPGEVGNFALAGHRTTYGRPLWAIADLKPGDPLVVETAEKYYVYSFDRHEIVYPYQVEILAPKPGFPDEEADSASMTLMACHPRFSAAQRIVAYSSLVREYDRADGPPMEVTGKW